MKPKGVKVSCSRRVRRERHHSLGIRKASQCDHTAPYPLVKLPPLLDHLWYRYSPLRMVLSSPPHERGRLPTLDQPHTIRRDWDASDLVGRGECHLPWTCILAETAFHGAQNLEKLGAKTTNMAKSICGQYEKRVCHNLISTPTSDRDPEIGHNGWHVQAQKVQPVHTKSASRSGGNEE